jgi:predicted RNase H-like nuclease (RuvC/YqgF family)
MEWITPHQGQNKIMENSPTWIVLAIQGVLAVITLYSTRRKTGAEATKTDAEASSIIGGSWKQLADELQEQIKAQDRRISKLMNHQAEQDRRLAEQDATIAEQGGIIMQLRERVTHLEAENNQLKIENNQLKQRSNRL